MSRPIDDEFRGDRLQSSLREPDRALPASLRRSLLAIPEDADLSHLYAHALDRARESHEATGEATSHLPPDLRPAARGVVEILVDFFRHELRIRPLPAVLRQRLGDLPRRPPLPRWIAEPRWAAAACWVLAFLLTFGTGDVSARLVDAAGERLSRAPAMSEWAVEPKALPLSPASLPGAEIVEEIGDAVRAQVGTLVGQARRPLDWTRSHLLSWQSRAEAAGARVVDSLHFDAASPDLRDSFPTTPTPRSEGTAQSADVPRPDSEGDRDEHRNPHR